MKINEKEMLMMLQDKMLKAAYFMKQRKEYLNNSSFEQMLTDLNERGIIIKENEVVEKYKELRCLEDVDDYFYHKYEVVWNRVDNQKQVINSDIQLECFIKIIKKHFDYNNLPDSWFIQDRMQYIEDQCPKEKIQKEIMSVIMQIIECGKIKNTRSISDIVDFYDCDEYFRFFIKKCHNRDQKFKALMKNFYDAFDDIDQSIYKIK